MNFDGIIDSLDYNSRVELLRELINSFDKVTILDLRRGYESFISGSNVKSNGEEDEIIIRTDCL